MVDATGLSEERDEMESMKEAEEGLEKEGPEEVVLVVKKEEEGQQQDLGGHQDAARAVLDRVHSRLLR